MSVETFLGNPPANISAWIVAHSQPAGHPETRVKYSTASGFSDTTFNIVGELTDESIDNILDVKEVDIGNTVTGIGYSAFWNCNDLMNVTIPNSVINIGDEAFLGCTSLTDVIIPNSVTSIGERAFENCSGLTSVTFQGKTLAQVSAMNNYSWGIENTSIINVA